MALDEQAVLRLNVEVQQAVAAIEQVRSQYDAAVKNMQTATKAGLDPASAEFQHLKDKVSETGQGLLDAGQKGRDAFADLANATGQGTEEIADLDAGLATVRGQLKKLETEGVRGISLLTDSAEKLGQKFRAFGVGLVAGILLNELTPALRDAASGLGDFVGQMQTGGSAAATLGEQTRALGATVNEVAQIQLQREAEAERARANSARSIEDVKEAIIIHNEELANAEEAYQKAIASSNSLADVSAALERRRRALAAAERDYGDALSANDEALALEVEQGKKAADQWQQEIDAEHALTDALTGNRAELEARVDTLGKVIAAIKEHGTVNKAVAANIREEVAGLTAAYKEFGIPLPESLAALNKQFPPLAENQKKATAGAKELAAAQREVASATKAAADAAEEQQTLLGRELTFPGAGGDPEALKKEEQSLQATVAALKKKQDQTGLNAEEIARLFEAEDQLHDVQNQLNASFDQLTSSMGGFEDAAAGAADVIERGAQAARGATGYFNSLSPTIADLHPEFEKLDANVRRNVEAMQQAGPQTIALGKAAGEASAAVQGLAQRQAENNLEAAAVADAMRAAATSTQVAGVEAKAAAPSIEDLARQVAELKNATEGAFNEKTAENIRLAAAAIRTDWVPAMQAALDVALKLRDCVNDIEN